MTFSADRDFEAFFEATQGPLKAFLLRSSGSEALAEDLVQEAYLRVLERPPVATAPEARRAYLFTTAARLLKDHWRRERWMTLWPWGREDDDPRGVPEPASDHVSADRSATHAQALARGFSALRPRQRALLWLAHVEGLDHGEIAQAFGLSRGSVKVLLHRARTRMIEALEAEGWNPEALS